MPAAAAFPTWSALKRATGHYLRSVAGGFAHREAFASQQRLYDDSQLEPKQFRGLSSDFAVAREWEQHYCKGRKTSSRGNPTKWYARLLALDKRGAAVAPGLWKRLTGC